MSAPSSPFPTTAAGVFLHNADATNQHADEIHGSASRYFRSCARNTPQAYFQGIVSLARIIKWDVESTNAFDRSMTPEQIMDVLEERFGPEGRKLFERFLWDVNELGAQQQLAAQAQRDAEHSRERGPG